MKNHFAKNTMPILVVTPKGTTKLGHSCSNVELCHASLLIMPTLEIHCDSLVNSLHGLIRNWVELNDLIRPLMTQFVTHYKIEKWITFESCPDKIFRNQKSGKKFILGVPKKCFFSKFGRKSRNRKDSSRSDFHSHFGLIDRPAFEGSRNRKISREPKSDRKNVVLKLH